MQITFTRNDIERYSVIAQILDFLEIENNIIFIGRSQKCTLVLNDEEGVSRVQFTLVYDKNNNEFYLYDGFYCEKDKTIKTSTNGIWLLLNDNNKMMIKNEMVFKTGKTLILCQYKEI